MAARIAGGKLAASFWEGEASVAARHGSVLSMTLRPPDDLLPALLVLGSNMGNRLHHLRGAVEALALVGNIDAVSPVYESPPAGHIHQGPFLNLALQLRTSLGPVRLLMWCKGLEFAAGRRPGIPYGPRPLDVDIVSLGTLAIENERVSIPHPRLAERPFMTAPLADIAPSETLAGHDATLAELDRRLGREGLLPVAAASDVWPGPEGS